MAGEEATSDCEFGDTLLYLPRRHKKLPQAFDECRNAFGSEKFPKPERTIATESTNSTETTAGLQLRPRATKQSLRRTLGATTEDLQPVICNTVGHATTIVREETSYTRRRTTDERDGRYCRGTRNETTARYVTSTTSVDLDVKFTTTTG